MQLIKLLMDCDMDANVKPYFLVDYDTIDPAVQEFECYGHIIRIEEDGTDIYLHSDY